MKKNKLISVIVPVYQVELYVRKCLDSIIEQEYENLEIILIDDGSTDGSSQICDDYKSKDKRIKVIHRENGGLSSARNAGIDIANGEYIAFIDSDDWVDPKYIEKLYSVCEIYDCDIAQCSYENVINEDDFIWKDKTGGNKQPMLYTGREFSYATYRLLSWECNLVWNKLYKKSLFEDIRFPVGKIHEDEFTTYKLVWKSDKVGVISDQLYYYRYRIGSIMQQSYNKQRLCASEAFSERELFYKKMGEMELSLLTKKWHLEWIKWQRQFVNSAEDNIKEEILSYLKGKEENLRKELGKRELETDCVQISGRIFPFGKIKKGASIIIYGGGKVGRQYYRQVYQQDYCEVVLWVDKNVKGCRAQGIPVSPVEQIACCNHEWDYIVIAIDNAKFIYEVMQMLQKDYHISANRILY